MTGALPPDAAGPDPVPEARRGIPTPILLLVAAGALGLIAVAVAVGALSPPAAGSLAPGATPPPSPVTGVVIDVQSTGLERVQAFTVRTFEGASWTFALGVLENAPQFPPSHLRTHMADGYPVVVSFRVEGDALVAYRLEDGPEPARPTGTSM